MPSEASAAQGYDRVLVSLEGERNNAGYCGTVSEYAYGNDVLVSGRDDDIREDNLIVRQAKYKKGDCFIGEAVQIDVIIADMLKGNDVKTPEDYERWLSKNITYRSDAVGRDNWALPEEALDRGYGDCEDYAFLSAAVLRVLGYEPKIMGVAGRLSGTNHAICAFQKDGKYLIFDNQVLKATPALTEKALYDYVANAYLCAVVLEIKDDQISRHAISQLANTEE